MKTAGLKSELLLVLGGVPLLTKLPYMVRAWRESRPDRWDWVFLLGFLLLSAAVWPRLRAWRVAGDRRFLIAAAVGALLYGAGFGYSVHAVSIVGAMIFAWGMAGVAMGLQAASAAVPLFGLLGLSCTGTTYWIGYFSGCDGLTVKVVAGTVFGLWAAWTAWRREIVPLRFVLFGFGIGVMLGFYGFPGYRYVPCPPFHPALDVFNFGAFIGREIPPSDTDRRFFGESTIQRAFFAGDDRAVAVLKVCDFEDVHKIHPAGYCLRAAGRNVLADRLLPLELDRRGFQVNEVLADNGDGTFMLLWAWYSSDTDSSGNFLFFRRFYAPGGGWSTYQVAVGVGGEGTADEIAAARGVLAAFLTEWGRAAAAETGL